MLRKITTTQFGTRLGHCECGEVVPLGGESECECGIIYDGAGNYVRTAATWRANWEDAPTDMANLRFRAWE